MGNIALSPCLQPASAAATVRLVYWGGQARLLATDAAITAGDVAAELPPPATDHVVCPADAFFVGLPVPAMSPGEELLPGRTYFVLPAARFPCLKALTAATLAALSPNTTTTGASKTKVLLAGHQCPFEYVKSASGGAALIRVLPEFIEKVITCSDAASARGKLNNKVVPSPAAASSELCSTPELKRHYAQLVGARGQAWSPRLETIAECDRRRGLRSPVARMLSSR